MLLIATDKDLQVLDLQTAQTQLIASRGNQPCHLNYSYDLRYGCCWWQTAKVVGYVDPVSGGRKLVKVSLPTSAVVNHPVARGSTARNPAVNRRATASQAG